MMTPGRARRADPVGGRAAHPVRHQGRAGRLPGAAPPARRRARWICCSSPPSATRSTTTRSSRATRSSSRWSSTSTRSRVQNLFEYSRGLPADQTIALDQRRREPVVAQHRRERRQRLHARHRQRRQRHHRGDPEAAQRPVRAGRSLQVRRRGQPGDPYRGGMVPQQVMQIIEAVTRLDRRRDPAQPRLLPGDQRRGGDHPHLRDRRHGEPGRAGARPSSGARACRSRSGLPIERVAVEAQ